MKRQPHAVLDLESRRQKALKIEQLLDLPNRSQPIRLLEVGTGSGGIANYFGTHPSLRVDVDAVDIHDNRQVDRGYRFQLVHGTKLPYPDGAFDVVLSNHVIEHVGDAPEQYAHLRELRRVMGTEGIGYLAVPNRWMLVEPHYRLAFLSWLPRGMRTPYLRLRRGVTHYDCEPLRMSVLEEMLRDVDFRFENVCTPAMRMTLEIERAGTIQDAIFRAVPDVVLSMVRSLMPTLIYRFWRR